MIAWLQFIIMKGLEDKGFALLNQIRDEQELSNVDVDNTVMTVHGDEVQQVKDAAAELQADIETGLLHLLKHKVPGFFTF